MSNFPTPMPEKPSLLRRIWRSIFPVPIIPRTQQQRRRYFFAHLVLHFRPATLPEKTLQLSLTWGLGGMAVVLVVLQIGTGLLMKFVYEPNATAAYESVRALAVEVPFGMLVRNVHHWGANLLVLVVFLHLLRVFFTGGFHPPRQFNWIIGLMMFAMVLLANLTGYLLPWDQLAFWAITVSTGMLEYVPGIGLALQEALRGGAEIGPATLRLFFAAHTAVVPLALVLLMAFHFWRIRKAGGLVLPRAAGDDPDPDPVRVPALPNLLVREATVAAVLVAAVLMLAIFFNAPLAAPANPGLSPNPTKAPWYFSGLQELLLHLHPTFAVFVIPFIAAAALVCIPYVHYTRSIGGVWFVSRYGRRTAMQVAVAAAAVTALLIGLDEWVVKPAQWFSGMPDQIGRGLIPTLLLLAAAAGVYRMVKGRGSDFRSEAVQAVFVLVATGFILLTAAGWWFRGKGMSLAWPW
jgi:quinol-cytochrome oxidoreductase complex cytochrome b subunit